MADDLGRVDQQLAELRSLAARVPQEFVSANGAVPMSKPLFRLLSVLLFTHLFFFWTCLVWFLWDGFLIAPLDPTVWPWEESSGVEKAPAIVPSTTMTPSRTSSVLVAPANDPYTNYLGGGGRRSSGGRGRGGKEPGLSAYAAFSQLGDDEDEELSNALFAVMQFAVFVCLLLEGAAVFLVWTRARRVRGSRVLAATFTKFRYERMSCLAGMLARASRICDVLVLVYVLRPLALGKELALPFPFRGEEGGGYYDRRRAGDVGRGVVGGTRTNAEMVFGAGGVTPQEGVGGGVTPQEFYVIYLPHHATG